MVSVVLEKNFTRRYVKTLSVSHCMGLKRTILEILTAVTNDVVVQSWSKETIIEERIRRCHNKLCSIEFEMSSRHQVDICIGYLNRRI